MSRPAHEYPGSIPAAMLSEICTALSLTQSPVKCACIVLGRLRSRVPGQARSPGQAHSEGQSRKGEAMTAVMDTHALEVGELADYLPGMDVDVQAVGRPGAGEQARSLFGTDHEPEGERT